MQIPPGVRIIFAMKRTWLILINIARWVGFGLHSLFWMTAAIVCRVVVSDVNVPLSWARRFWGRGVVWMAGAELEVAPGFVPEPGKPYIFAMNHQSMFDIAVAFVGIPVNLRFIAKKVLRSVPFLGWYMSATGMVFIDRRDRESAVRSLEEACEKIRGGISILVYPEGTRAEEGGPILPFKKGPFVMAIQAGVPIVPVAIEGSAAVLPRSSVRIKPGPVRLILGEPIPTAGLTQDDREHLMKRVRDAVIDLHERIGGRGGDKGEYAALPGFEGLAKAVRAGGVPPAPPFGSEGGPTVAPSGSLPL